MASRIIKSFFRYFLWIAVRPVLSFFPPFFIWKAVRSLNSLYLPFLRKKMEGLSRIASENCFSDGDISKRAITEHILNEMDIFYFSRPDALISSAYFSGGGLTGEQGSGTLLLLSHFGPNTGIIPSLSCIKGYHQIGIPPTELIRENMITDRSQINTLRIKDRLFSRAGTAFLHHESGLRNALKLLRAGKTVGIAADGRYGRNFVRTEFLGRDAFFSEGPFKLAYLSGASIIPVFPVRGEKNIVIHLEKPINLDPGKLKKSEFIHKAMNRYIKLLEAYVRKYPGLYLYYLYLCDVHTKGKPNSLFQD